VGWSWTVFVCRVVDGRLGLSHEKGKKGEENVTSGTFTDDKRALWEEQVQVGEDRVPW